MLAPLDLLAHLKTRLAEDAVAASAVGETGHVSLVLGLPEAPVAAPRLTGPGFQLLHRRREEVRAGYGIASQWSASGPERFGQLHRHAHHLGKAWHQLDPDETGLTGFALLGLSARHGASSPSGPNRPPESLLWLPATALCVRRGQAAVILSARLPATAGELRRRWSELLEQLIPRLARPVPGPLHPARLRRCDDTPDSDDWRRLVSAALDRIDAGELQKVVLTRRLRVESSRRLDIARLVATLGFFFPSCQIIDIRHGALDLVAATPERLLSLRGNRVEVDALAGTASRAADTRRDCALREALRGSAKNLHEHGLVVGAIADALAPRATRVEVPTKPDIMRLNNAQHLWTRIGATLDPPSDLVDLARRLHPTPATNGSPRQAATDWLRDNEPFDRGWYTGAAGILEPDLSGELWVLLRCAQLRDRGADLYAGAGIVAGSDPALEWRETEHKLAAMLTALLYA